ncbi:penicillin-binding protein 1F [Halobacillus andaensis]|uniref:Penicillin-binding protein 1F n=1 Tax=Halobacillus andaensis TaxID=1176239 RepID=A0A917EUM0_HALAA|nr:PBP1A family penicillin-binding protein [Halobacillus andaensis]MBP2004114.1 penicillin-binding protein 2A [Halobacillus andaensis]GGF15911.1 penicillin-binding protein 1F [Halobacillus andaensis]
MKTKLKAPPMPRWVRRVKWPAVIVTAFVFFAIIGFLIILFGGRFIVSEKDLALNTASTVETKEGEVLERIYTENRTLVDIDDIPAHVQEAFIAIEDGRFYEHSGVDFKAILRAVYRDIIAMDKVEGGSTITQQLAKNLFLTNEKSWMRKTKEVMAAIHLERKYTKDEILELYLNTIYFGSGAYGVEEASKTYFNTSIKDLTVAQGALLAGLPKAPNSYSPFDHPENALNRRNTVLARMEALDMIAAEEMVSLQGATLGEERREEKEETWSNSYVDAAIREAERVYHISRDELKRGGYKIVVEMDPDIQRIAADQMKNGEFAPGSQGEVEGAFTLMNQKTGAVAALVGGRDFKHGERNRALTRKQPGSVIKPLSVYGPALMDKKYIPYSLLVDEERSYGDYTPRNYDGNYDGFTSIYQAIIESKNAPAVWLLDQMGIDYAKKYLDDLGLSTEDEGLSLALGGLSEGYTPLQLTEAYRSFANEGKVTNGYTIQQIIDRNGEVIHQHEQTEKQVFNKETAWNMTQMLEKTVETGTAQAGSFPKALAGKTGTQQHPSVEGENKDAWFVGYTPEYVGSLWMGYDQSGDDYYLTGGSEYPTALMKSILSEVDDQKDMTASFKRPEGAENLPEPITLPEITDAKGSVSFGGFRIVSGTIEWTPGDDDRIIYRIYEKGGDDKKLVGDVKGEGEYRVSTFSLLNPRTYVVVPYDPLTGLEGEPSNEVTVN